MDPHLNLFYSYNRDNELIENNLTRAWIVTLRLISSNIRGLLLHQILDKHLKTLNDVDLHSFAFDKSVFALQGYMSRELARSIKHRYILAISSNRIEMDNENVESNAIGKGTYVGSIPDGWIYEEDSSFCFLIEAKVGSNPLDSRQLFSHAEYWLGFEAVDVPSRLISITWIDVLDTIRGFEMDLNKQERLLLVNLKDFLIMYGYKPFNGLDFHNLQSSPNFALTMMGHRHSLGDWLDFTALDYLPKFSLGGKKNE